MRFLHLCILSSSFFLRTVTRMRSRRVISRYIGRSRSTFLVLSSFSRNFSAASRFALGWCSPTSKAASSFSWPSAFRITRCFQSSHQSDQPLQACHVFPQNRGGRSLRLASRGSFPSLLQRGAVSTSRWSSRYWALKSRSSFTDRYLLSFFRQTSVTSCCHLSFVHFSGVRYWAVACSRKRGRGSPLFGHELHFSLWSECAWVLCFISFLGFQVRPAHS